MRALQSCFLVMFVAGTKQRSAGVKPACSRGGEGNTAAAFGCGCCRSVVANGGYRYWVLLVVVVVIVRGVGGAWEEEEREIHPRFPGFYAVGTSAWRLVSASMFVATGAGAGAGGWEAESTLKGLGWADEMVPCEITCTDEHLSEI